MFTLQKKNSKERCAEILAKLKSGQLFKTMAQVSTMLKENKK